MTYLRLDCYGEVRSHSGVLIVSSTRLPSLPGRSSVQVLEYEQLILIIEKETVVLFARLSSAGVRNGL